MRAIEIFRLRRQRDKAGALSVLAQYADLAPEAARQVINAASGGGKPQLLLASDDQALACISTLVPTGFVARFAPAPDFEPSACAEAAVQACLPQLPGALQHSLGALLLQGDSLGALELALLHLRQHGSQADRKLAERSALACGLLVGVPSRG